MMETGIDIIEVARFKALTEESERHKLEKLFTPTERTYALSFSDPEVHLAGMFAAKEASHKAMQDFRMPLESLEIRHHASGKPEVWRDGRRISGLTVSISHTATIACAVAFYQSI